MLSKTLKGTILAMALGAAGSMPAVAHSGRPAERSFGNESGAQRMPRWKNVIWVLAPGSSKVPM